MRLRIAVAFVVLAGTFVPASSVAGATNDSAMRESAVAWALSQVGTRESGTTNCSPKINRWQREMGLRVPPCRMWCGAFVHQAFRQAGVQLSARMIDPDRSYRDAAAGRRGLRSIPIDKLRRGDIVFSKFHPGEKAGHVGIVLARPSGGTLKTVDGNTNNAVRLREDLEHVVLAARVTGDA